MIAIDVIVAPLVIAVDRVFHDTGASTVAGELFENSAFPLPEKPPEPSGSIGCPPLPVVGAFEIDFDHPAVDQTGQRVEFDFSTGQYKREFLRSVMFFVETGISPTDAVKLLGKPVEDRLDNVDGLENPPQAPVEDDWIVARGASGVVWANP